MLPGLSESFLGYIHVFQPCTSETGLFLLEDKGYEPHHGRFLTRYDSNQPAQLQRLARVLKLWI